MKDMEGSFMQSLRSPSQARDALSASVEKVLSQVGWKQEELMQSTHLLMDKLVSYPAIENGVTDQGITEPRHTSDRLAR